MLSAVAARKAALAAHQDRTKPLVGPEIASPPPTPSPVSPKKTVSKRKPSAQAPTTSSRKAKKKKTKHEKARYFAAEDAFVQQDDIIVVDEDSTEDSESGEDEIMDQDRSLFAASSKPMVFQGPATSKDKRAWSPSHPLQDSSDELMDDGENEPFVENIQITTSLPRTIVEEKPLLSSFEPYRNNNIFALSSAEISSLESSDLVGNSAIAIIMTPGETLSLLGTYALTVMYGSVYLAGVTLHPSRITHHVFAPRCSPVPALQCFQSSGKLRDTKPVSLPGRVHPFLNADCAVVILRKLCTGVEGLGRVCRTFEGVFEPSRWHRNDSAPDLGLTGVRMLQRQHRDVQPFVLPSSWEKALSAVCPVDLPDNETNNFMPVVCFVKGPKKTGKSTFARTLVNRLLTRYRKVAYLECDVGQSEFTPGGMVALNIIEQPLFGPPFTHPSIPHRAHYIGSASPRASPSHYLSAIQALVQSYRLDVQSPIADIVGDDRDDSRIADIIPLVVNNMGWNKGLGADLTRRIEDMVEPTDFFEVEAPPFERSWPEMTPLAHNDPFGHSKTRSYVLEPIAASILVNNYSAADHRNLSILSYFHAVFPVSQPKDLQQISAASWDTAVPLCARPPYEVDWTQALDKVFLIGAGMEDVIPGEIERVLNGAIVGLISCDSDAVDVEGDSNQSNKVPYIQGASPVSPFVSACRGLALIRSVSTTHTHMHVLTPLPPYLLATCRLMVKGDLEVPVWGMLDFRSDDGEQGGTIAGVEKSKVPYLQWGKGEGIGGERRRIRRNLMRKGQL